jgi:hypothetical protein
MDRLARGGSDAQVNSPLEHPLLSCAGKPEIEQIESNGRVLTRLVLRLADQSEIAKEIEILGTAWPVSS